MTAMQRWMYRTLLQKAFVCSTRPFPPDDDSILWKMTGCPSRTVWDQHKEHVKAMFSQRIVNDVPVLFRQRLADDWAKIERIREVKKGAAAGRWKADAEVVSVKRSERLALARKLGTHTREEFQEMVNFFEGCCVKCGIDGDIVKDHIVPIYQGGSDSISNLQPLCSKCNGGKGPDFTDHRRTHRYFDEIPKQWLVENACRTPAERLHKSAGSLQVSEVKEGSERMNKSQKPHANGARVPSHRSEQEQRQIIAARDKRLADEDALRRELNAGAGPVVPSLKEVISQLARAKTM